MIRINIPELERTIKLENSKNVIVHQIEAPRMVEVSVVETKINALIVSYKEHRISISKKNHIPEGEKYCIISNKVPTIERLEKNELKLKWLNHPLDRDYGIREIIESWNGSTRIIEEDTANETNGLREPQVAALYSILSHLKVSEESGTVVMPTGTGKTETMLSALVFNRCEKLIVTVPSDALREQLFKKFKGLGLLRRFGIISDKGLSPKVGFLKQKFKKEEELQTFLESCNVIVSTMNIVADSPISHQKKIAELCSHIFIDEAHHVKAKSWDSFRKRFEDKKVLQFTATPFRNDKKRLEGKTVFNFPLKKAQEQGYFKKIELVTIREYDDTNSDKLIADVAIARLREDIQKGYNHILLARCKDKSRAKKVFELYKKHGDLKPVLIHSGISGKKAILDGIISLKHKVIVAVDMLGEGFDLPQLKIAAFHDIRKSLPVTLQFAGRFTRTSIDEELGDASFIVNIAETDVTKELEDLYAQDADWNLLLSSLSSNQIDEQIGYEDFISGFEGLNSSSIPFQNIRPALSTVVYKNHTNGWTPGNISKGIPGYEEFEYRFHDINWDEKMIVAVYAEKSDVDWGNVKDIYELKWEVVLVYWEVKNNLLFIHSSDKSTLFKDLAKSIIGENAELINQINIFKAFHNIKRVSLQNVGLKEFLGKHIRFRMSVGRDIEEALSRAETARGQKAFVFGTGYENGNKITLGCSYKGRIWSYRKGDLKSFKKWCDNIGQKLVDDSIDPNQVLRQTLIPEVVTERPPEVMPVGVDWNEKMYSYKETKFSFIIDGEIFNLSNLELKILNPSKNEDLQFELVSEDIRAQFVMRLIEDITDDGNKIPRFEIEKLSPLDVIVKYGRKEVSAKDFFQDFELTFWFADGSSLSGNYLVKLKQVINPFPVSSLITWDWEGIDLSAEAQGVTPKNESSIQYNVIQRLTREDFDIIYDDDYSGEIADVITIKRGQNKLIIGLYHLKYASGGNVSGQIGNFYEVCGQAQKCIHWKHKSGREFFNHLLRRETKRRNGVECSRIEKGTKEELERLLLMAKKDIPMEFEVYIVQPSLSRNQASSLENIMTLLGVTENYLKETAAINLNVICSA